MTDCVLKVGDVVQLKSGGPVMTIQGIGTYAYQEDMALCVWFDKTNRPKEQTYKLETLKLAQ